MVMSRQISQSRRRRAAGARPRRRRRCAIATPAAPRIRWNRSGSSRRRLSSGNAASGISVSPNRPRQLSAVPATPRTTAMRPVPPSQAAVTKARALARSRLQVSSAAITPLMAFVPTTSSSG
jgi:hypothetical protein